MTNVPIADPDEYQAQTDTLCQLCPYHCQRVDISSLLFAQQILSVPRRRADTPVADSPVGVELDAGAYGVAILAVSDLCFSARQHSTHRWQHVLPLLVREQHQ